MGPEGRTKRDSKGSCSWGSPSQWLNPWSAGHGLEKRKVRSKKGDPTKLCHKITWQGLNYVVDMEQNVANELLAFSN